MSGTVPAPAATTDPAPAATPPADPAAVRAPPAVAGNILADAPPAVDPAAAVTDPAVTPPADPAAEPPKDPVATEPRKPEEVLAALKLPDGLAAEDPMVAAFVANAAESGMSNEAAQALVDKLAPAITAELAKPYQAWADLQTKWQGELRSDTEIGGEKLMPAMGKVQQAFNMVLGADGAKAVNEALAMTGGGNNPAIVKAFYKMAARLTEQSGPVTGTPPAPSAQAKAAAALYPSAAGGAKA